MDFEKLINGPMREIDRLEQKRWEDTARLMREDIEHSRELARRARNIADAAESTLRAADNAAAELAEEIALFEREIQPNEEARISIVGGPAGILIFPESIEAIPPDKLVFTGHDQSGALVRAIQHVSQLSIVLKAVAVPKGVTPQRTGFHHPTGEPSA